MPGETLAASHRSQVVVYEAPDGEVRVDVRLERETVWLTQQQMATRTPREHFVDDYTNPDEMGVSHSSPRTLREHLLNDYTLNERRLAERGLREARECG